VYPEIIGSKGGLVSVMPLVELAAESSANVLIHGETGTGKELIAHAIHRRSNCCRGPFVVANCAAIPRELLESEMFGHVRGAYTGAIRDHKGYFEAARGGTLLLDEIGDLHADLQAKMLHVVESGQFRKVGSTRPEHNRARLISATNRPLQALVRDHDFRADLYYRINVLSIAVPPLRERGSDIVEMAEVFLARAAGATNPREFDAGAKLVLRRYLWPGNVRELRNCIERVLLANRHPVISGTDVERVLDTSLPVVAEFGPVRRLAEVERDAIESALRYHGGNRTRAAADLGISRRTLQLKLKRHGAS